MCIKKEYMCYKGKEDEECCNARVREALRNRTYAFVLILGIALMIISLVIKTSNDAVFVNQVSFASTITSIILSVIAIWMSITGERSTNEIKAKVSESVDRLLKNANESEKLVINLRDMFSEQNESYNNIKDRMEFILLEVQGVREKVVSMEEDFMGTKENKTGNFPDDTFLFCKNIIDGIPNKDVRKDLCIVLKKVFEEVKNNPDKKMADICREINSSLKQKDVEIGIIISLVHNGFFKDKNNYEKMKEYIEKTVSIVECQ